MTDQYMEHKRLGNAEIHPDDFVRIWYVSFAPCFAFGVLDSALMIFAGQSINSTFAATYGMSIMGAAALGNAVSNVVLFQFQVQCSHFFSRLGLKFPVLSTEQMYNKDVEWVTNWAKGFGLLCGSICGLFPLLFYNNLTTEEIERQNKAMVFLRENKFEAATPDVENVEDSFGGECGTVADFAKLEEERKKMAESSALDEEHEPREIHN